MHKNLKSAVVFAALLAPLAAHAAGGGGGGAGGGGPVAAGAGAAGGAAGKPEDEWSAQPRFWSQSRDPRRTWSIDPTQQPGRAVRFQRTPNSGRASSAEHFFVQRQRGRWKFADRSQHAK